MQKIIRQKNNRFSTNTGLLLLGVLITIASCTKPPEPGIAYGYKYLVSSSAIHPATRIDPNFKNGWGIAFSGGGVAWVSVAGPAGISAVLDKEGNELIAGGVTIPSPGNPTSGGHPSGQIFNNTSDFKLPNGNPARFIFAGLDGIISGWNGGPAAVTAIDNTKGGAVYSGIAMAQDAGSSFIYAANFSLGRIDVWDKNWAPVTNKPFVDPDLPADYSPFNIQNVSGLLFVMYAKGDHGEEEPAPGAGIVDVYSPNGNLISRFASHGSLNAPWGITEAPKGFWGDNGEDNATGIILIGNFGDGHINVFDKFGSWLGQLNRKGQPLVIEGLWGIAFPPSTATTVDPGRLYFAAGPEDETNGVFGYIRNLTKPSPPGQGE